jgi:hypothetical protein
MPGRISWRYPSSALRVKACCMMRRWSRCSSKSSSRMPRRKNGLMTGAQPRVLENTLSHRLEIRAGGRNAERPLTTREARSDGCAESLQALFVHR